MVHSCPFGLFILVLFLVTCVCADDDVDEHGANESVKKAKKSADDVFEKAKREVIKAEEVLEYINTQKRIVEEVKKGAENSAKGNTDAASIAQKAQIALDGITELNPNALEQANKYIERAKHLKTTATTLANDANTLLISSQSRTDYKKLKGDADVIQSQAELLKNNITTASSYFVNMVGIKLKISKFVSDARLVKCQVDVIVAVEKFKTLLEASEKNVKLTEEKKGEVDAIEKKIQELYRNNPSDSSSSYFTGLHSNVLGSLRTASHAVQNAQTALEYIVNLNQTAYDALQKSKAATNDGSARSEVGNANYVVQEAEKKVKVIQKELEYATTAAENALLRKNDVVNVINQNNNTPNNTKGKDQKKTQDSTEPHNSVQKAKGSPAKSETTNHTITNMEKPVSEETEPTQNTRDGPKEKKIMKPTINTQDHTESEQYVKETVESGTVNEAKQPTIINLNKPVSEGNEPTEDTKEGPTGSETIKPTTINSDESMNAQDMENTTKSPVVSGTMQPTITNPNKPVSGGTDPTQSASSDNAMTVSVPLLLALIVCAALN